MSTAQTLVACSKSRCSMSRLMLVASHANAPLYKPKAEKTIQTKESHIGAKLWNDNLTLFAICIFKSSLKYRRLVHKGYRFSVRVMNIIEFMHVYFMWFHISLRHLCMFALYIHMTYVLLVPCTLYFIML